MSALQAFLLFVATPLTIAGIAALIILGPGWTRAGRYRPGDDWNYDPLVIHPSFSGDVKQALTQSATGVLGSAVAQNAQAGMSEGGSSARW